MFDKKFTMRVGDVHLEQLAQVAQANETSKSETLRQLIVKAADEVKDGRRLPADEERT